VSFPQISIGWRCRRVSAGVGYLHGHRAPIKHRPAGRCSIGGRGGGAVTASKQRTSDPRVPWSR
jgi:hypothetical protein